LITTVQPSLSAGQPSEDFAGVVEVGVVGVVGVELVVSVPVLVIGPETDTSRGLPMTEIVVSTDGSEDSEQILPLAAEWSRSMKLKFTLIGVASEKSETTRAESDYLSERIAELRDRVPEARSELVRASDPVEGLLRFMDDHEDAILAMSTHGRTGGSGRSAIGSVAQQVIARSKRAVLLRRPT